MNAIEIRNLSKSFRGMYALNDLHMNVPIGAIYGFIGENGSGKSTTEKLICGHLVPDSGEIKLFGKDYTDPGVRVRVGALIENAGLPSKAIAIPTLCFIPSEQLLNLINLLSSIFTIFKTLSISSSLFFRPKLVACIIKLV